MARLASGSRVALALRRLRRHFGITAPVVSVRARVPGWLWAIGGAVGLAAAVMLAGWVYDTGLRYAGFDRSESETEIRDLRDGLARMTAEAGRLQTIVDSAESKLQIERTSVEQLTRQVKALEDDNVRLRESLAVFENLANGGAKQESVTLSRLRVEPEAERGHYRFRVLASRQGSSANQEFRGQLQFYLTVRQASGESGIIILPRPEDPESARFPAEFKNFRNLEGRFAVPPDSKVLRVEVRLVQAGTVRASQSQSL